MTDIKKFILENDIQSIEWLVQESTSHSILFYHFLNKTQEDIEKFEKRIAQGEFALCITNFDHPSSGSDKILHLNDSEYTKLKLSALNHVYPLNLQSISMLGVTGTNGKTTVVNLCEQLLSEKKVLSIGTLGVRLNAQLQEQKNLITSLAYIDLHKLIAREQMNLDVICMELTSHGLEQGRYGELLFDAIAWTNFSQDHLDYHKSMDAYFKSKMLIFKHLKKDARVFVPQSEKDLVDKINQDVYLVDCNLKLANPFFKAKYNKDNLALALSLTQELVEPDVKSIENLQPPEGRFNIFSYENSFIVVDYAHTPDGLLSICQEIRENFKGKKLITLFGCGGDRDKSKRPLMGKAACQYSDKVILTSDNPRFEDPQKIIDDILPAITIPFENYVDREQAISEAFKQLSSHVLLIAGKGHENYIDIAGVKEEYSDISTVKKLMGLKKC
tara:strand:+ start:4723 stop:6054 length:1332 start_codon:yes stop_codon:yes gene_type:complete